MEALCSSPILIEFEEGLREIKDVSLYLDPVKAIPESLSRRTGERDAGTNSNILALPKCLHERSNCLD